MRNDGRWGDGRGGSQDLRRQEGRDGKGGGKWADDRERDRRGGRPDPRGEGRAAGTGRDREKDRDRGRDGWDRSLGGGDDLGTTAWMDVTIDMEGDAPPSDFFGGFGDSSAAKRMEEERARARSGWASPGGDDGLTAEPSTGGNRQDRRRRARDAREAEEDRQRRIEEERVFQEMYKEFEAQEGACKARRPGPIAAVGGDGGIPGGPEVPAGGRPTAFDGPIEPLEPIGRDGGRERPGGGASGGAENGGGAALDAETFGGGAGQGFDDGFGLWGGLEGVSVGAFGYGAGGATGDELGSPKPAAAPASPPRPAPPPPLPPATRPPPSLPSAPTGGAPLSGRDHLLSLFSKAGGALPRPALPKGPDEAVGRGAHPGHGAPSSLVPPLPHPPPPPPPPRRPRRLRSALTTLAPCRPWPGLLPLAPSWPSCRCKAGVRAGPGLRRPRPHPRPRPRPRPGWQHLRHRASRGGAAGPRHLAGRALADPTSLARPCRHRAPALGGRHPTTPPIRVTPVTLSIWRTWRTTSKCRR